MGLLKSRISKGQATAAPFAPASDIPQTDVQRAIQYVKDWFDALVPSAGAAPKDAQFLVSASDATLTAERVTTNTPTVEWDHATAGQAKANVVTSALNAADLLTLVKTVDGDGSGLDADTLDGNSSAFFATAADLAADAANLAAHIADGSDAHDASAISVLDAGGNYAATEVEAALAEVMDALQAHEADGTDAHDASAISILDAGGNYAATNAETALAEVMDALEAHIADTTAAHAASAISYGGNATLSATTVEAALDELDDEKQPLDADLTAIAALSTTTAGRSVLTAADPNADRVMAWDDSAGAIAPIALADIATEAAPASGDYALFYLADGTLAKVDFDDLGGGGASAISPAAELRTASATITIPTGATKCKVTLIGGGGGGGGCGATNNTGGGAGGGGATCIKYLSGLTAGNTLALTVNSGGGGGSSGSNAGSAGGSVTLASGTETITTLTAGGGAAGPASGTTASEPKSAAGGTATNGDLNETGAPGFSAILAGNSAGYSIGGRGGMSGGALNARTGAGGAGVAAGGHGGGGAGAIDVGSSGSAAGGAGSNGCAIFEWYT